MWIIKGRGANLPVALNLPQALGLARIAYSAFLTRLENQTRITPIGRGSKLKLSGLMTYRFMSTVQSSGSMNIRSIKKSASHPRNPRLV
jgi:hypothetical protein